VAKKILMYLPKLMPCTDCGKEVSTSAPLSVRAKAEKVRFGEGAETSVRGARASQTIR
jgi:hypothetical protein